MSRPVFFYEMTSPSYYYYYYLPDYSYGCYFTNADTMVVRASFQGGSPASSYLPGYLMLPDADDDDLPPEQPVLQKCLNDYSPPDPSFTPYYPLEEELSAIRPASFSPPLPPRSPVPALAQPDLSWTGEHHSHLHDRRRPRNMSSLGHLRSPLSEGRRGHSSKASSSQPISDVSSLAGCADMTCADFESVIDSMDAQASPEESQLIPGLDSTIPEVSDAATRDSRPGWSFNRGWTFASANASWLTKLHSYANSRLPPHLRSVSMHIPTWPLLCLAAQYSNRAYLKPTASEKETYISHASGKTMVIKSVALDHMDVIVFAVRGSTMSFKDWATNMDTEPSAPYNFLDDSRNTCHTGFLSVARQMVKPVATRLRQLLEENPSRASSCSLIITGHSAGGAVASLLYTHMLSVTLSSELTSLRSRFKRIHCVTFGAPPVSRKPLRNPPDPKFAKWLFFSFINEGDPVARADMSYMRSLLELYNSAPPPPAPKKSGKNGNGKSIPLKFNFLSRDKDKEKERHKRESQEKPVWHIPTPTLALPGEIVVLRRIKDNNPSSKNNDKSKDKSDRRIGAHVVCNEDLRDIVFGNILMHPMKVYERRIEMLATEAVTARSAK